jgi:hypothetical protein
MKLLPNRLVPVGLVVPAIVVVSVVAGVASSGCSGEATTAGFGKSDGGTSSGEGGSSGSDGGSSGDTDSGSTSGTDSGTTGTAPTWTMIYGSYFAAGTAGHCGNSGCHLSTLKGFKCGSDKTTCYNGFVSAGYITPSAGASSPLADPQQSCLTWLGGNMPPGGNGSNTAATTDLTAWANAGAKND